MMVKFPEADARLFKNKFVCKSCKRTLRTSMSKVLANKVTCRKCGYHGFRPRRKK